MTAPTEAEPGPAPTPPDAPPAAAAAGSAPVATPSHDAAHAPHPESAGALAKVAIGALGVVYGDIGTSPLYALRECFNGTHSVRVDQGNVMGVLSLVFWALTIVVVVKYLSFVMRADNNGEGGILALLALVKGDAQDTKLGPRGRTVLVMLGLFGASLLYGEGMITPVISVLSAVEGLEVATSAFKPFIVPITLGILVGLFLMQKRGTAGIGAIFGPATLLWFITIAVIGVPWIVRRPSVLLAVNPYYGARFFLHHGMHAYMVLGAVVLCITGGEALYADMGHFGKRPIRVAWYAVVFPALLLNYFGQGAMLLERGAAGVRNPFFELISGWVRYPVVVIATMAAVVASQALISGSFSLTQQAVQLGYCPRVTIQHTSGESAGQIYIPEINTGLMLACIVLVLAFRDSTHVAAAYGIAVTGTMSITSILLFALARYRWNWSLPSALSLLVVFLSVDLAFFGANVAKITHGGWVPLAMGATFFTLMTTWQRGRDALRRFVQSNVYPLDSFMSDIETMKPVRVKGTAVFMTQDPAGTPIVLLHHFKHNKVLHEQVVLLSVVTDRVPEVGAADRVKIKEKGHGFYRVEAHYGFMQTPHVPEIMRACEAAGLATQPGDTSYFLGRETLLTTGRSGMPGWRKTLFGFMSRNARPATAYFGIPPNRVVELGTQIEI